MKNKDYISDELLAAYLDGNTNEQETLDVLQAIGNDEELEEALDIVLGIEDDVSTYDILPMMRLAAESGKNVCSVLCEAYVLHRRGIHFDEKELLDLATQNNWLTPKGTPLHAIGQLLAHHGQMVSRFYDATIEDMRKALSRDNDVLVVVDSDKLYPDREDLEDAPNHAVIVTAIDEDTNEVTIYDPENNSIFNVLCPIFEQAWKESHHYMIQVLQTSEDYTPHPVTLDDIQLTDELLELQEAIAENAHEVWAEARMRDKWTYGPERDDNKLKHPDLIPYSALPDSEKEYDRRMAFDTIKLVKKLGFEIFKK